MELILFSYYSYQPRVRVEIFISLPSAPIVGDFINIPGSAFKELSNKIKDRDSILKYGLEFKVAKRLIYCNSPYKEAFRIDIIPAKNIELLKE